MTRGRLTSAPSQVCFDGIIWLCLNAGLVIVSVLISAASVVMKQENDAATKKKIAITTALCILLPLIRVFLYDK
jgi:hypothetical protein